MSEQQTSEAPQQPYDSTLKSLFEGQTQELIAILIEDAEFLQELSQEALKPPLRADLVYLIRQDSTLKVAHFELETNPKSDIAVRMLEYFGILYRKYNKPIIPIVICPFRASYIPTSPLRIMDGDELILEMRYRVITLWTYSVQDFLDRHDVSIYALLPTMSGATYERLASALDEMKEWYNGQERRLSAHLLFFSTFLNRSDMVSPEDKRRVQKKMQELNELHSLIASNPLVQQISAEAKEAGHAEGFAEGEVVASQKAILTLVEGRFPPLKDEAQRQVPRITRLEMLDLLLRQIVMAPNEEAARFVLDSFAA